MSRKQDWGLGGLSVFTDGFSAPGPLLELETEMKEGRDGVLAPCQHPAPEEPTEWGMGGGGGVNLIGK